MSANNYMAATKLNNKIGFYNVLTGAMIEPLFDKWSYPHVGKFIIVTKDGYQGAVGSDCKLFFDCIYSEIIVSQDGKYIVVTNKKNESAIFDSNGKMLRPFGKEYIVPFINDLFIFRR